MQPDESITEAGLTPAERFAGAWPSSVPVAVHPAGPPEHAA